MQNFKRYYNAITYLEGLSNLSLEGNYMSEVRRLGFYLERTRYFLNLIGNPDKGMNIIHVTGTAGKGSVTNLIHEMIHSDGKKVGSFTSPFVSTSIEKIRVGELYISPDEFADIVDYLVPFIDRAYTESPYGQPSYFEIFLAIALLYFKQEKCEWVVLEVGMGGRYDATNIVENTRIAVITGIDYDHTEIIGKTLTKIAYEKVGIIKNGCVFFTGEHRPRLLKMFKEICNEKLAQFNQITFPDREAFEDNNQLLARRVVESIGVQKKSIQQGITTAKLQCRFETVQAMPRVIVDGAHNRIKMRSTVNNLVKLHYRKLHLIISVTQNKDYLPMLSQIIPLADSVYFTRFQIKDRKVTHPKELLGKSKRFMKKRVLAKVFLHPKWALKDASKFAHKDDLILVTGSFFLAGELRKQWVTEEKILQTRKWR